MKVKSYKSMVMSILLIARETQKMAAKAEQKLNIFHQWCFRRTLGIIGTYQDCPKWRDTEIMQNWETNGHNHATSDKIIVTNSMSFRPKTPKKPHYDGCQSVARGSKEAEKYLEVQYPQWPSTASMSWAQIEEIVVNRDESKEVVARCTCYERWWWRRLHLAYSAFHFVVQTLLILSSLRIPPHPCLPRLDCLTPLDHLRLCAVGIGPYSGRHPSRGILARPLRNFQEG